VDKRALWVALAVWLAVGTAFLIWFDFAAATAILHPQSDTAGNTQFQVPGYQNTVYPFTYAGALVSVLGVAVFVFQRERPEMRGALAVLLGLVVGNLASIGMINCYEQVFVGLRWFTGFGHGDSVYWLGQYWGTIPHAGATLAGMLPVLAVLPWARRRNWPGVSFFLGVYAVSMAVWFFHGYPDPQNGTALDYWMNALSRISSQLVLVAIVTTHDPIRIVVARVRRIRARPGDRSPERSAPLSPTTASVPDLEIH
jgi:hypothetical protein